MSVERNSAGIDLYGHTERSGSVLRDDAAGQSVHGLIRDLNRFLIGIKSDHRPYGSKYFKILCDIHFRCNIAENRRHKESAFALGPAAAEELCTLINGMEYMSKVFCNGVFVYQRAALDFFFGRVAVNDSADLLNKPAGELFLDGIMYEESL